MLPRCSRFVMSLMALTAVVAIASADEGPFVSLLLNKVTPKQLSGNEVLFICDVRLDNDTGRDLITRSNFFSVYDGLELVVTTTDGKTLAQQSYLSHQSPMFEVKEYILKKGTTKGQIRIPIRELPKDVKVVKVRLVGTLPKCSYDRTLSTESLEVKIQE